MISDQYFRYYSDDAILWFPEGRTDIPSYKKEWTEFIKSGGEILAGTLSDMHIRFSPQGERRHCKLPAASERTREASQKVIDEVLPGNRCVVQRDGRRLENRFTCIIRRRPRTNSVGKESEPDPHEQTRTTFRGNVATSPCG